MYTPTPKFSPHLLSLIAAILLALAPGVHAERGGPGGGGGEVEFTPAIEWDKRAEIGQTLTPYGLDLLGDNIDPHTGTISFQHTDISLPGNSSLPVALIRELTQGYFHAFSVDAEFGDWNYVVPRLHVLAAKPGGQQSNYWVGDRCSDPRSTFDVHFFYGTSGIENLVYPVEYTNGLILDAPGYGSQHVLAKSPTVTVPFPAEAEFITAQNWYLKCGAASDGGEGFVAIAPNGDQYRFDRYIEVDHRNLGSIAPDGGNSGGSRYIGRVRAMLMATEVKDVHSNWVRYEYDSSDRLTRIHANDGRSITLSYSGSSGVVSTATANGRVWTYSYVEESVSDIYVGDYGTNKKILSAVTLPDGQSWSFDLLNMHDRAFTGTRCVNVGGTMSLTHPNGATGTYSITETLHRKGYAHWMTEVTLRCFGGFVNPREPTRYDIYHEPLEVMSVTQKTISGPKIPTSQWNYTYESDVDEERYPVGHQYEGHPIATSGDDPTNWTKVANPDGSETTSYHFWHDITQVPNFNHMIGGKLDRVETRDTAGGTVLETTENEYVQTGTYGGTYIPNDYTYAPLPFVIEPQSLGTPIRISRVEIKRDGDTFTTEYSYNTTQTSASYSYGHPIQTSVYSNVSTTPRVIDKTYEHNDTKWVLALPKTVTVNSRAIDTFNYDANGKLDEHWQYGIRIADYDRYTSGTAAGRISAVRDALGRETELLLWHRGTPQRIERPDNESVYQYVDDNGWMTRTIDARNHTTNYGRDAMGRLTLIDPPGTWASTNISYNLSGGGAVQTITKGQGRTTITYDELFRPILERAQALDTGWSSYVNTAYDEMGRVSFKSQPSSSPTTSAGTDFAYDGLGRISTATETVSPFAQTRHTYHSSHRHRVYDPSNAYMDYYSYGYEGPGNDNYRAMYHSSGQQTYVYQNVWGETDRVRQWGTQNGYTVDQSQYYYYNASRRVCRHYAPEQGATKYQYDAVGQLVAYAKGQSNSGCTVPTNNTHVSLSYDVLGRLTARDYLDTATPGISRTYDADGNVLTVNRAGVNWSYTYNDLSMIMSENLVVDGRTYSLAYLYDTSGNLIRKSLPTGRQVNYTPDGLGRPKTIKDGAATLASAITYHPAGSFSSMTYGNGQVVTQTLNARLLASRLLSTNGSQTAIDQTYSYDARANVTGVIDAAVSGNNRTYGYDSQGRLTSASGPWGSGSYTYDALDNLRQKVLGARSVSLSYDSLNRLAQSIDTGSSGTRSLTHDARGNVTALGGLSFTYDYSDQPVSISGAANGAYTYDGNFKRVKSTVNGKTIYSIYDASDSLVHIDKVTDASKTDYVEGPNGALARIENNNVTYLHPDYQGSAQSGTNNVGSVVWREQYTPFGEEQQGPSANDDQMGFTGHIRDSVTGLNYMLARYYDPVIGRFLSVDPVGFSPSVPGSFGRFTYAYNNPLMYVDPDGRESLFVGRPTFGKKFGTKHAFLLQTTVDAKGKHTISRRETFGAAYAFGTGGGETVRLTGSGRDVDKTDRDVARNVVAHLNDPSTVPLQDGVEFSVIPATDETVSTVADLAYGSDNYQFVPDQIPLDGTNSSTAPFWIAKTAAELAGNKFSLPSTGKYPGATDEAASKVDHDRTRLQLLKEVCRVRNNC